MDKEMNIEMQKLFTGNNLDIRKTETYTEFYFCIPLSWYCYTYDVMEAIAIMEYSVYKKKYKKNKKINSISLTNEMKQNIDIKKFCYWITGRNEFWAESETYFNEIMDKFITKKIKKDFKNLYQNAKTIKDIFNNLKKININKMICNLQKEIDALYNKLINK